MKKLLIYSSFFIFHFSFITSCFSQTFASYTFDSLSSGMTSPGSYVLALAMKDSATENLYAGGHFTIAGRKKAVNIAEWKDTTCCDHTQGEWLPLGAGVDSDICALAMFGKYLYAGGKFDTAGGISVSHIARWDTAAMKWDSLVGKLNGNIYALCVYNNELYVGGDFTLANGDTVNRIAKWNGSSWSAVGNGFDRGAVYALTVSNDTLYAGGSFLKSGGRVVNHIAKWNSSYWDTLLGGTNNTVYALSDYWSGLIVGGAFTKSGNVHTNYVSLYDYYNSGNEWDSLGSGTNDTVRALNEGNGAIGEIFKKQIGQGLGNGDIILIGGNFDSVGGYSSHYIAGWDGGWDTVGELNGPVFALSNPYPYWQGDNYVGGAFTLAKNTHTFNADTVNNVDYLFVFLGGGIQSLSNPSAVDVFPNPSNGKFTLEIKNKEKAMKNLKVYNVLGQQVFSQISTFNSQLSIDLNQPNGIYFYRVVSENGELIGEGKMVIQK